MSDRPNIYASDAAREDAFEALKQFPVLDGRVVRLHSDAVIDAFLAKSLEGADEKLAEIQGFKDLFSGAFNVSQSLLEAADKFEAGKLDVAGLFQAVRRDAELLHQITEEAPPSALIDEILTLVAAMRATNAKARDLIVKQQEWQTYGEKLERDASAAMADEIQEQRRKVNALRSQLTAQKAAHAKMLRDRIPQVEAYGWVDARNELRRLADKIEGGE